MGDHKNTILAILLSLIVVVGWQYLVGYPQMQKERQQADLKQQEQSQPQPGAVTPNPATPEGVTPGGPTPPAPSASATSAQPPTATREAVLTGSPRVAIDTPRLSGSIDLRGGRLDDLSLQQY